MRPTNNGDWLVILGNPDVETLVSICLQILELISERKGTDEAIFAKLRQDLEALKDKAEEDADAPAKPPVPPPPADAKRQRIS
jgi:hypothetical protein